MRQMKIFAGIIVLAFIATGCGIARSGFDHNKKYSPRQLDKDYTIFQDLLQENHPGLYWYTSKDSMDYYFEWGRQHIKDSLTEPQFRKVISYVLSKMDCGHTTSRPSKNYSRYLDTTRDQRIFPLSFKFWPDTTVISGNLLKRDEILKRGTIINSINNRNINEIVDSLFKFISSDGHNLTHKYQTLSNRGGFGSLYTSVFGRSNRYTIGYSDSAGKKGQVTINSYDPLKDTVTLAAIARARRLSKKDRKQQDAQAARSLRLDTASSIAYLELNTFGRGYGLKKFFRQSFQYLQKHKIDYLVIDVRSNGGGSVTNSTLLSKYLIDRKFKVADSLYAISRKSPHSQYIKNFFFNKLFMLVFTRKKKDGHYHFGYYEKHYFKPKKKDHFDGQTYILTGGNSFSATTLFASSLIRQDNVTVVGEETGGGAYGNTAWLIPDVKLPETKVEFRLPLFRLVIDKTIPKNGLGIQPEVEAKPTIEAIRKNEDFKLNKVMELIQKDKEDRVH